MIIIPTHISRVDTWLKDCLASIKTDHQIMVVFQDEKPAKGLKIGSEYTYHTNGRFDPGGIVWAMNNLGKDDEFFILHDSCVIKDNLLWKVVFEGYFEESVALASHPTMMGMFLGKYRMPIVTQLKPPAAKDKKQAVELEETWNREYCQLEQPIALDNSLTKSTIFEERHGRKNMVLENRWLIKYKGTYDPAQLL